MNRLLTLLFVVLLLGSGGVWLWISPAPNEETVEPPISNGGLQRTEVHPKQPKEQAPVATEFNSQDALPDEVFALNRKGLAALDKEESLAAIEAFEAALALAPQHATLKLNLATALVSLALQQQEGGDHRAAIETLKRAVALQTEDPSGPYWLAHLYLGQGDRDAAKAVLDEALDLGIEHALLLRKRADLAAVEGELDQSVSLIDQALALDPENANLQDRADQLHAERDAFQNYLTDATAHFDSRYNPQDRAIVDSLTDLNRDLEDAWQDVVDVLGVQPRDRLLVIWLDAESYRWQAPEWSAALFDGRVRIVIEDYERQKASIRRTLRHELTHAVLHTMGTPLPTWLHEGMAQSAEGRDSHAAASYFADGSPKLSLEQMDGNWTTWTDRDQVTEAYAYALAFCTWLRQEYSESVMANLFLNLEGRSFQDAWLLTFGVDLAAADMLFREQL
ncbi:MAG: tetratricopeptide repeat protein [Planctomycetes bacterium]|nr:tetratricopeptide repeat protein [Planctomycetota bacterium]MCP4772299.1 tetratricopeptide repeat protein [Planctomycetota bacterium]MCP4861601.1 tetratricopeptide repeat protein [Planctomycetota bacterium]